jgi:hypothetical protein
VEPLPILDLTINTQVFVRDLAIAVGWCLVEKIETAELGVFPAHYLKFGDNF